MNKFLNKMRKNILIVFLESMCLGFTACEEEEPKVDNNSNGTEQIDSSGFGTSGGNTGGSGGGIKWYKRRDSYNVYV